MYDNTLIHKYYDPYCKTNKLNAEIDHFLNKYSYSNIAELPNLKCVSKMNVKMLRLINEYFAKYQYIMIICMTVYEYSRNYYNDPKNEDLKEDLSIIFSRLMKIMISLKKQHTLSLHIKDTAKKVMYDEKTFKLMRSCIDNMIKRIDYLINNVISSYIEITPLYDYKSYLENNGKDLLDDMLEYVEWNEFNVISQLDYDSIHPLIVDYVNHVNNIVSNISECKYKQKFDEYYEIYKKNKILIEENNRLKKEKELQRRIERATKRLYDQCYCIRKSIDYYSDGVLYDGGKGIISIIKLKNAASDFKKKNRCKFAKIIVFISTKASNATISYYNPSCEYCATKIIKNAKLFRINDELPEDLQKRKDAGEIVVTEIII